MSPEEVARMEERREASKRAALLTPGTRTEHLRLTIDFHITIAGRPPDDDGLNEPDPVYHGRQARLLEAVRSNPAVLKRWMVDLIVSQMLQKDESYWDTLTEGGLAPALAALPAADQEYFAEMAPYLSFDDMIDLFSASFTVAEDAPVITGGQDLQRVSGARTRQEEEDARATRERTAEGQAERNGKGRSMSMVRTYLALVFVTGHGDGEEEHPALSQLPQTLEEELAASVVAELEISPQPGRRECHLFFELTHPLSQGQVTGLEAYRGSLFDNFYVRDELSPG